RKTGKSAILLRLYNIIFNKNDGVIPFYFEMKQTDQWIVDFSIDFFLTFLSQYVAFKTRDKNHIFLGSFHHIREVCKKRELDFLNDRIDIFEAAIKEENIDLMWNIVRDAPRLIADRYDERIVQIIDEFQYINRYIFWDKGKTNKAKNLAGSYFHTCEYKNAPILASGSWVGWLMDDLSEMLPGRFKRYYLENMPKHESLDMIYRYSFIMNFPVTEETASAIAELCEGNPCYISSLFESDCPDKDLASREGVLKTLEFETNDKRGAIRRVWMEYINYALSRVNSQETKNIILYHWCPVKLYFKRANILKLWIIQPNN
ncbi:MAG: hypothetical protein GY865_10885, partial [candidate division Zixibacteria bacterium]|nr:hypothetical protein [candidate division Zixibacteria bacterium]